MNSPYLVDVDVRGAGHCDGRYGRVGGVHVEGDHAGGEVDQGVLRGELGALVHPAPGYITL